MHSSLRLTIRFIFAFHFIALSFGHDALEPAVWEPLAFGCNLNFQTS